MSEKRFDPYEWSDQLESGSLADPQLELAAKIRALRLNMEAPSPDFQNRLRTHLLNQFDQLPQGVFFTPRRLLISGAALVIALLFAFLGLRRLPGSVPSVNAAEIFELAGQRLSERLAESDLVYDQLIMDWKKGGFQGKDVVAELWRSADGTHMRYQMVANRKLLYFDQYDGKHVWRASYVHLVEGDEIKFVYQADFTPDTVRLDDEELVAQLVFRGLGKFWIYIDQLAGYERAGCADLFCVLSSLGQGWHCEENRCTLNLGHKFEARDFIVEAEAVKAEKLPNGRELYHVRLRLPEGGNRWYHVLKFDASTYDLLEIEYYSRGKLQYRIRLVERQTLAWSDLPEGFFQSIPDGVEVRLWESDIPLGHHENDRVWIISADPPPGAHLSGIVNAHLEIGYRLTSVEEAAVAVGGLNWAGHDTRVSLDVPLFPVKAGEGTIQVNFQFDAEELGEGEWDIHPGFINVLGLGKFTGWNSGGDPPGLYLKWFK